MQVTVTFRHVGPSVGLRQYAEEKVQRIGKFIRRPIEAHVTLSVEKQRHIAEIQLIATNLKSKATEQTTDLYSAIDLAMSKLERQVKRRVAKTKDRKGPSAASGAPTATRTRTPSRVQMRRTAMKPMSVDEAILQLDTLRQDVLLFRNAATDMVSVLHRRSDGGFDLLESELP